MRKKTIVFLTTLSILAMTCVGFSAWSIATTPTEETFEGEVIVDDAVRLIDVGLSYNLTQYPIQGFEYYPITDNEGNTSIYFSSAKLIYTIIVTKSLYEKVAFDNVSQYYLTLPAQCDKAKFLHCRKCRFLRRTGRNQRYTEYVHIR